MRIVSPVGKLITDAVQDMNFTGGIVHVIDILSLLFLKTSHPL
jgi:hypothetical protein